MRGFGAMCLLRRRRCLFLAPQCTALRCPWVSALVLPVVRVPSCARGLPGVLFTAHLHMYNKSVLQYCRHIKNDHHHHHEPRTKFHLILLLLIADWQTVRFISKQIEAVDIGW
jgi:hypothetical protein